MTAANGRPPPGLPGASVLPPLATPPAARAAARRRTGDRFAEINGFIDHTMRTLTPAARSVWFILWRDTKPDGLARAGQTHLARRAGVSDRAVRDALKELLAAGVVKLVSQGRAGVGVSVYRVRGVNPNAAQ